MGAITDILLGGNSGLEIIDELEEDVKSALSVIIHTDKWNNKFLKDRQKFLHDKYSEKFDKNYTLAHAAAIEPLWWLHESYFDFLKIKGYSTLSKAKKEQLCANCKEKSCPSEKYCDYHKTKEDVKIECFELLNQLYASGDEIPDEVFEAEAG